MLSYLISLHLVERYLILDLLEAVVHGHGVHAVHDWLPR